MAKVVALCADVGVGGQVQRSSSGGARLGFRASPSAAGRLARDHLLVSDDELQVAAVPGARALAASSASRTVPSASATWRAALRA